MAVHIRTFTFSLLSLVVMANGQAVDGDIRLNSFGTTTGVSSGRVEIYYNFQWGTVCDDSFFQTDADVACRQLGFSEASSYGNVGSLGFSQGTDPTWLDEVTCSGTESRLVDCNRNSIGNEDCSHSEDIAVNCITTTTSSPGVESRDEAVGVRLVSATGLTGGMGGRVEVYYNDRWNTIQDSSVRGASEADVICRQLGFSSSFHYGDTGELGYSENSVLATMSLFTCGGSETRWNDCSFATSAFGTSDSWAVSCAGTVNPSNPLNGEIRLNTEGTSRPFSGRLEVYYNGQWGTVCDDGFGENEANVACKQLGLQEALYYGNVGQIGFGQGSGSIWLDGLSCSFGVTALSQCSSLGIGVHNCGHNEDVALVCTGEGSVRVTSDSSGTTSATLTSGRLEVFAGGRWGTVCDDPPFGQTEADIACRGIGQGRADRFDDVLFSSNYDISLPILLDDVSCTGSETNLLVCEHRGIGVDNCGHSEDIEISCSQLSTGAVIAIAVVVPLGVIIISIIAFFVCCCYCYCKTAPKTSAHPNSAYPMQQTSLQTTTYPVQSGYTAPSQQYTSSYPTAYPSAPQQPPAPYPTGQAPPAPYPSGPQAPPAPYKEQPTGVDETTEVHPSAPPAYEEYPGQYPTAPNTGFDIPQQQPAQPQYY